MCGIAGIINFEHQTTQVASLIAMTQSLQKRGPDDEGYILVNEDVRAFFGDNSIQKNTAHILEQTQQNFTLSFGFRQLKIIDLSINSHQPMTDETKNYWIIYNGELYNYKAIREELLGLGYHFKSNSDTEVVLNAFIAWGENALQKMNGMFAFAIYNHIDKSIFLARDRLGIKPLYYYQTEHQILFASTATAIIKSGIYKPEINLEGLWENFRFTTAQRPTTVYKNIVALEPAHFLSICLPSKKIRKQKYWNIPTQVQDESLTEKKSQELIAAALQKAIDYQLVADVPLGSYLSGGIDSSLITCIATKKNPAIRALTLGFPNALQLDETAIAKQIAALHLLNHHISTTNGTAILEHITNTVLAYEEPYHTISVDFLLAKMAKEQGCKVVLNGLGSDELFGGYDVFAKQNLWKTLHKNKQLVALLPSISTKIKKGKQLATYTDVATYYAHYFTTFTDTEISHLFHNHIFTTNNTLTNKHENNLEFTDTFEALSYYSLQSYIGNHQLRALDATTMFFSVEGRFPFLDHEFVETCFKIPSKYKIKHGTQKYILKKIAAQYLPKQIINLPKKGLQIPLNDWMKSDLKDFVIEHLNSLKSRHIFEHTAIDTIVKNKNAQQIWQLVSTEIWLQEFIDT